MADARRRELEFGSASILSDNRVCFNIKGNNYRLIVAIEYRKGFVLVKMIIEAEKPAFEKIFFVESDVMTWTDADNERMTAELEALFGSEPGTPGWFRMDVLADLIEAYEAVHYPFPPIS